MFILMPCFAAAAATVPVIRTGRFGAGVVTYIPYAALGFVPLYLFDYAQPHGGRVTPVAWAGVPLWYAIGAAGGTG
jgi:hypothetical protein